MDQHSTKNSWGTPAHIIEVFYEVAGRIDIDPASNAKAQEIVGASIWYGPGSPYGEDGLTQPWEGKVWLNPPYGKGLIQPFADKLYHENRAFRTKGFAVLVNLDPSTRWFKCLLDEAYYLVLLDERVAFIDPTTGKPVRGNARSQVILTDVVSAAWNRLGTVCEIHHR